MTVDVEVRNFGAEDVVARDAVLAGIVSSSVKKRSARGSAFDATFGAGGADADLAAVAPDFTVEDAVEVVREAAAVVVDFGEVEVVVEDLAGVDLAEVFALDELVALFKSFLTLLVTLLTWPAIPLRSFPREPVPSVTSAIVFSNSPESSEVIRRKSRTARPAWPATSGSLPGPKITRAATRMIIISHAPIPIMFTVGLDFVELPCE